MSSPAEPPPLHRHVGRRLDGARQVTAGVNPAYGPTWASVRARVRTDVLPRGTPTSTQACWAAPGWCTSGDGRSESGLRPHLGICQSAGEDRCPPPRNPHLYTGMLGGAWMVHVR